jgi:hypothetical protein
MNTPENIENKYKKFIVYRDNSKREWVKPKEGELYGNWVSPVIFEYPEDEGVTITEIDKIFKEKFGFDVSKHNEISFSIEEKLTE